MLNDVMNDEKKGIEIYIYVPILGPKKLGEYETLKAKLKKGARGPMVF